MFGFVLAALFADLLTEGAVRVLRALRLLPPPVVPFDGLLDELHRLWPLEEDERSDEEILSEHRAALEALLRAA